VVEGVVPHSGEDLPHRRHAGDRKPPAERADLGDLLRLPTHRFHRGALLPELAPRVRLAFRGAFLLARGETFFARDQARGPQGAPPQRFDRCSSPDGRRSVSLRRPPRSCCDRPARPLRPPLSLCSG
jgi:hypothetical protein